MFLFFLGELRLFGQGCPNAIVCENALTGNPRSEWDIVGGGDPSIQGFGTDISVNRGQTISFKVNTSAAAYRIDIYRLGWYNGLGARKITSITPTATLPQVQPACLTDPSTGLFDCGNWGVSASWTVPSTATSGVYIGRLVRSDTGGASHIVFVVRDDAGQSDVLCQTSDLTWQAYNVYGGASLYQGTGPGIGVDAVGRAYKVSYNRPFVTRATPPEAVSFLFAPEYPMIRWLEANGYNVSYASGVDTDRRGVAALKAHKVYLSVGHDEYWSSGERANVEAARDAGVHLAFFSGNEMFWKTRWENSIDGTNTPYRTLVCYKETHANAKIDPSSTWTGTWRDPRFSPPADGGRPENAVMGQIFTVNSFRNDPIVISASEGRLRLWRNTGIDKLLDGFYAQLPAGVLGYEWDETLDNGFRPAGVFHLSTTSRIVDNYLQNYGSTYAPGPATHRLSLYRSPSGALVFGAGTIQWSWGLDATHDTLDGAPGPAPDSRMQQATVNLLADIGAQPASLQSGLVTASASTDTTAPVSTFLSLPTVSVPAWTPISVFGITTDLGGGKPAGVELSLDGGTTWHPLDGTNTWSAAWMAGAPGTSVIKSRAVDDSGRLETPGPGLTLIATTNATRCTLFAPDAVPVTADSINPYPIEQGVRFKSDFNGWITAIRFYKSAANTGLHIANLWSNTGTLLATVNFTNETASGWQEVKLPTPVAVTAGARYVASYHMENGHYPEDSYTFSGKGIDRGPLHAPPDSPSEPNGVYVYGASAFPNQSYLAGNYWVDVVFTLSLGLDTTPPIVTTVSPQAGSIDGIPSSSIAAQFNEPMGSSSISSSSFILQNAQGGNIAATISYDPSTQTAQLRPAASLSPGTYTATIKSGISGVGDSAGNKLAKDFVWSFTIGAWTLWAPDAKPVNEDQPNASPSLELGTRFQADMNGVITAIRFFKAAKNTGAHQGHLWRSDGTLLASVSFTNETAYGWQQAQLSTPVAITAGTRYVVSYHLDSGHYSADSYYFNGKGTDRGPLHAPADSAAEPNGVYIYGPTAFPTSTFLSGNYWVDVVFASSTQVPAPTFSPAGGTYDATQSVTISCSLPGAQIYYTTNGSAPTTSSTRYTTPIAVATTTTIKALAVATGWTNSAVGSATYTIQTAAPTFSPAAGTYSTTQSVSLSDSTSSAVVYYTTNGSTPTTSSARYSAPISVSANTTIKAIAVANGSTSSVASAAYAFQAAPPTFTPGSGTYATGQSVKLADASPGAKIYYTTDGSTPTTASTLYSTTIAVTANTTINAIAAVSGWTNSSVATASYTISIQGGTVPAKPGNLAATAVGSAQVNLTWTDASTNESSFKIERKTGSGGTYTQIAAPAANTTSYSDATVAASTTYYYRVRASNATGDSSYSNEASATTTAAAALPAPWIDADIGSVGVGGAASYANGTFTVQGSGADIWNAADAFNYVYQPMTGNAEIVAKLVSVQNTDGWAKAGVMMRETLSPGSEQALMAASVANGLAFQRRTSTGGASTHTAGAAVTAPYWVRLVRQGTSFTGYASSDGLSWTQVGSASISMVPTIYVGLAVTSHNNSASCTSVFNNVFITTEPASPSDLTASVASSTQINLGWKDNATNESGFKLERKTGAGGTYAQIATLAAGVTSYNNTGLVAGTTYYYRVRSSNTAGDSAYSNEASATTSGASIPTFRAAASAGATSGVLSLKINKPSGTAQNDVLIAAIALRPSSATITAPSGWTLVRRTNNSSGNSSSLAIYYKIAGASEATNYSWSFNSSSGSAGGIRAFSGVDTTNPVDVDAGQNTGNGLSLPAPSVTTRYANDMIVTSHEFTSAATFTPPSGMTEAFEATSDAAPSSAGVSIEGNYQVQAAVGATGTRTATANANADTGNAHTLALKAR